MTWMLGHKDEIAVAEEIDGQSDRGAAIIAAAMIEERLAEAIRSRFHLHPMSITLGNRIFNGTGPLAMFSAKIDVGFAMGLYGPRTYEDLKHLKWIRDRFAHKIHPLTFESDIIRNRCACLQLPKMIADQSAITVDENGRPTVNSQWAPPAEPRDQFY